MVKSWAIPTGKNQPLYYVSDPGTDQVYVYDASTLKAVGALSGFSMPMGECVDGSGNIWVVEYNGEDAVQYAHGGTRPLEKINTGEGNPTSCSVDPTTGDVAVGVHNLDSGSGWLQVCTSISGRANCKKYDSPYAPYIEDVSYDKTGNLYINGGGQGGDGSQGSEMAVFKNGTFTRFRLHGANLHMRAGLSNHDGVISLGGPTSNGTTTIYQLASNGYEMGETELQNALRCQQFTITGGPAMQRILCPSESAGRITEYAYPSGGAPLKVLRGQFTKPFAIVLSI